MPNDSAADAGKAASPSVDRALAVLECLAEHREGLGTSDLSRSLGVAKSSLHAILSTMRRRGFLAQDPVTKRYTLGSKSLIISSAFARRDDLLTAFHEVARGLVARCGETVQLAVLQDRHVLYVGKVDGTQHVRLASSVGSQLPAHATSLGKALLSCLTEDALDRTYAGAVLEPVTARTITTLAELKRELARVRAAGYAVDRGEMTSDVRCVGAPVRGADGRGIAAISISVPIFRIDDQREAELARLVRAGAWELSLRLGYRGQDRDRGAAVGGAAAGA